MRTFTQYYNPIENRVVSYAQLRRLFPNSSIPQHIEDVFGWFGLFDPIKPQCDLEHKYAFGAFVQDQEGHWHESYNVVPWSPEEYADNLNYHKVIKRNAAVGAFNNFKTELVIPTSFGWNTDACSETRVNINGVVSQLENRASEGAVNPTEDWRDADNISHPLDIDAAKAVRAEIEIKWSSLYNRKWEIEAEIAALTTITEAANYVIDFNC